MMKATAWGPTGAVSTIRRCSTPTPHGTIAHELFRQPQDNDAARSVFHQHYRGHFYAKAQNLNRKLRAAYDTALNSYDLLLMPTCRWKATPIPPPDAPPRSLYPARIRNGPQHRAVQRIGSSGDEHSCGMSDGLPIGLMLIGKYYDESTIYRAGRGVRERGRLDQDVNSTKRLAARDGGPPHCQWRQRWILD